MTIKELIEWAEKKDCLDCDICVQYRDDEVLYPGKDYDIYPILEETDSKKVIVL